MKSVTLSLFVATVSVVTTPAWSASPSSCQIIEQRITESTNEFVRISAGNSSTKPAQPAELYRDVQARRIKQQNAADKLWDLRTEMSNQQCAQAGRFMF